MSFIADKSLPQASPQRERKELTNKRSVQREIGFSLFGQKITTSENKALSGLTIG